MYRAPWQLPLVNSCSKTYRIYYARKCARNILLKKMILKNANMCSVYSVRVYQISDNDILDACLYYDEVVYKIPIWIREYGVCWRENVWKAASDKINIWPVLRCIHKNVMKIFSRLKMDVSVNKQKGRNISRSLIKGQTVL